MFCSLQSANVSLPPPLLLLSLQPILVSLFCYSFLFKLYIYFIFYLLDILSVSPRLNELKCITSMGKKVKIIESVATKWKDFGALLDFDPTGNRLNIIEQTERERPEECCQSMFQYWLEGHGVPATWRKLIQVLENCRLEFLAVEVKETLLQKSIGKVIRIW